METQSESIEIKYQGTEVRPTYGGQAIEVKYIMTHVKYGRANKYLVTCRLVGLETADPHLLTNDAEFIGNLVTESNDETLTRDAAESLFESEYL